jgi:hypothetical protein
MSANKLLVADAAAFCAKHGQIRSERQLRQVVVKCGYGIGRTGSDLTAVRAGSLVWTKSWR